MNNDQTGLMLSEISILAQTLENITDISIKCANIESFSTPHMQKAEIQTLKSNFLNYFSANLL